MKKNSLLLILFLLAHASGIFGQQPLFTQYTFDPVLNNPAFAGNKYCLSTTAHYKTLWSNMEGAPETMLVTAHGPVLQSGHSIGATIYTDRSGATSTSVAALQYAYRFQTAAGRIATGVLISAGNFKQSLSGLHPQADGDPALYADVNKKLFNVGFGAAWENEKGYFGIGIPGCMRNQLSETNDADVPGESIQTNLTGMYTFRLNDKWDIAPSALYKLIEKMPSQLDLQVHFIYNESLWLDAGFRTQSAYSAGARYILFNRLSVGYCYDHYLGNLGAVAGGGHEVMIGFDLRREEGE